MGDYITQADLKGRFDSDEQVAFLTGDEDTGTPDTSVLDEVIAAAEGAVNMRLASRYETPVSSTDATATAAVKHLTLDVAEVYLRQRKVDISEDKQRQLDRALEQADKLATGEYSLPGASIPTATGSRTDAWWTDSARETDSDYGRRFSRDTAAGL